MQRNVIQYLYIALIMCSASYLEVCEQLAPGDQMQSLDFAA